MTILRFKSDEDFFSALPVLESTFGDWKVMGGNTVYVDDWHASEVQSLLELHDIAFEKDKI